MNLLIISILYRLKANYPKIWSAIEQINSLGFGIFYARPLRNVLLFQINTIQESKTSFRFITQNDIPQLLLLLNELETELRGYFEAHDFTNQAITKQLKNKAFIMLGAFHENRLIGYFFLRAGINKKCFVGRLVHKDFRNKGIGRKMSHILHHAAWQSGFRVFATLSPNNKLVIQSHKKSSKMKVLKELPDNYQLVEFTRPD